MKHLAIIVIASVYFYKATKETHRRPALVLMLFGVVVLLFLL